MYRIPLRMPSPSSIKAEFQITTSSSQYSEVNQPLWFITHATTVITDHFTRHVDVEKDKHLEYTTKHFSSEVRCCFAEAFASYREPRPC